MARAAQRRELGAFEELARRVYAVVLPSVQTRLWQRLAQVISAEDVTQNVMVKLTEGLQDLEIRSELEFLKWLHRVVEHQIRDAYERYLLALKRDRSREVPLELARSNESEDEGPAFLIAQDSPSPLQALIDHETVSRAREALQRLPPDLRDAVEKKEIEGIRFVEIARHCGVQESTIRARHARGIATILRYMNEA